MDRLEIFTWIGLKAGEVMLYKQVVQRETRKKQRKKGRGGEEGGNATMKGES